jgi:hypothetical protein
VVKGAVLEERFPLPPFLSETKLPVQADATFVEGEDG